MLRDYHCACLLVSILNANTVIAGYIADKALREYVKFKRRSPVSHVIDEWNSVRILRCTCTSVGDRR